MVGIGWLLLYRPRAKLILYRLLSTQSCDLLLGWVATGDKVSTSFEDQTVSTEGGRDFLLQEQKQVFVGASMSVQDNFVQ